MPFNNIFKSDKNVNDADYKSDQLTIAVLLFRLVRSDGQAKMLELVHMSELLRKEFSLSQQELEVVFKKADKEESSGTDTREFAAQACESLSDNERVKLLEYLWVLAFADDQIEDQEVSLIKSVAKQLHLSEVEQATAQENAEKHLGLDLF